MSIREGASFLDDLYPQWYKKIDLEKLDLEHTDNCVLGQLGPVIGVRHRDYFRALSELAYLYDLGDREKWAMDHGFYLEDGDDHEYHKLTNKWKRAIRYRLSK